MSNLPVGPTLPGAFEATIGRPTTGLDNDAVETVGQTIRHAAGALEGLRDILERLDGSLVRAVDHRHVEEQVGDLFIRAQAFVDASIAETHERGRRLIIEAENEASRIVAAAREEARRILEESQQSPHLPVEAAHQLQTTVEHFGEVNRELLRELTALGQLLTGHPPLQPASRPILPEQLLPPQHRPQHEALVPQSATQTQPPPPPSSTGYWDTPRHAAASPRVQTVRRGSASRSGRWRVPGR